MNKFWANIINDLQQHPIIKGFIPVTMSVILSFAEHIEFWLRVVGLILGIILAILTIYAKCIEIVKLRKK
jgi:hypothetical protein